MSQNFRRAGVSPLSINEAEPFLQKAMDLEVLGLRDLIRLVLEFETEYETIISEIITYAYIARSDSEDRAEAHRILVQMQDELFRRDPSPQIQRDSLTQLGRKSFAVDAAVLDLSSGEFPERIRVMEGSEISSLGNGRAFLRNRAGNKWIDYEQNLSGLILRVLREEV